jgi:ArsR family transcriptional regulator
MQIDTTSFIPIRAIDAGDAVSAAAPNSGLSAALHALADANRLRIFTLLREGERCVCDIEAVVRLPQNLVSHHLRVLRESGLIRSRRDGRWMYYAIDTAHLTALRPVILTLFDPAIVESIPAEC